MGTLLPQDLPHPLPGFGGDTTKNQAQHRAGLRKTPIVLVHGNGGHALHPRWGMQTMKEFLKAADYHDWSCLGDNTNSADLNDPHRNRIDRFRTFVDQVRQYLGVERLDFIAHSLGCGMVNAYLRGLQSNGRGDKLQQRLDAAGTFVALAGATYGLGNRSTSEFRSGSPFEIESHTFDGVVDDSPQGPTIPASKKHLQATGSASRPWTTTRSAMWRSPPGTTSSMPSCRTRGAAQARI